MKKTKLSLILSGLLIVTAVIVASCKKSSTTTTPTPAQDTNTTSTTDNNLAQQSAHDVTNIGSQGIENDNGSLSTYRLAGGGLVSPQSASVTVNIGARNMTVTFNNTPGPDGHVRNGTVFYDWSSSPSNVSWFRDAGLILKVSTPYNDYTVDGNNIKINKKTIRNLGAISGNYTWSDTSNITITKPGVTTPIQWQGNWTTTLLNTNNYPYNGTLYNGVYPNSTNGLTFIDWAHAIVSVSGNFSGTASDGETYTGNISSPLVLNLNCSPSGTKYVYVAGVLNFTPTGKATRTINYGSGTCDLTCVVSIGSFSVTLTL